MFCPHCGRQAVHEAYFCNRCGGSLIARPRRTARLSEALPPSSPAARRPLGLAVAAIALGAVGLSLAMVGIGAVFGIIGLILGALALKRNPAYRGLAWAGIGSSAAALAVGAAFTGIFWGLLSGQVETAIEDGSPSADAAAFSEWRGVQAPDFTVQTLLGERISLRQLRGKRVLLDFWATWCGPCVRQIPHYRELLQTSGDVVEVLALSNEPEDVLRPFVNEHGIDYRVASARDLPEPYSQVNGFPTLFVIDRDGVIEAVKLGYTGADRLRAMALGDAPDQHVSAPLPDGADPNLRDDAGHTPLIHAAMDGRGELIEALLAAGAEIDGADDSGWTALMHAAKRGHTEAVSALLAGGADPERQREDGRTARDDARESGRPAVVALLDAIWSPPGDPQKSN
jgi:peroxiredoxin